MDLGIVGIAFDGGELAINSFVFVIAMLSELRMLEWLKLVTPLLALLFLSKVSHTSCCNVTYKFILRGHAIMIVQYHILSHPCLI